MGYNLERLKKQYGLGSASKLGYAGASAPVGSIDGLEGEALQAFIEQQRRYDADMAAYMVIASLTLRCMRILSSLKLNETPEKA